MQECSQQKLPVFQKIWWVVFAAYTILIAVVCLGPAPDSDLIPRIPHLDKMAHFVLFGIQAALLVMALGPLCHCSLRPIGAALVCVAYGLLIESLQGGIPELDRTFSMADWVADAAGALVMGWGFSRWLAGRTRTRTGGCCSGGNN